MVTLEPIASGALSGVGYDAELSVLTIEFRDGGTYEYFAVPESLYRSLLGSEHPWSELSDEVKRHPFRRVG